MEGSGRRDGCGERDMDDVSGLTYASIHSE